MPLSRAMVAVFLALLLAGLPAGVHAAAASMTSMGAAEISDCAVPCPMTGACHGMNQKNKPMSSSECAAFCNGFLALATPAFTMSEDAPVEVLHSIVLVNLTDHIDPPDPSPPKI
jgi:hypothetical protein